MTDTPHYFFVKALSWGTDAVTCVVEQILRADAKQRQTGKVRGYA
jgi:hypothetical protein